MGRYRGIQQRAKGSSISIPCPAIPSLRLRAPVSVVEVGDVVATDMHGMATTSSEPTGPQGLSVLGAAASSRKEAPTGPICL